MTQRATLVLSLCFALLTPYAAQAQDAAPAAPAAPVEAAAPTEAAPAPTEVTPIAPLADAAPADQTPPPPAPPAAPPPAEAPPVPESVQTTVASDTGTSRDVSTATAPSLEDTADADKAKRERCAQLMAQGQTALAQAEDCGGGDTPIFAGSILSLSQTVAPMAGTLPDSNNSFAALTLYAAPRLRLTEKWGLTADVSMGYEQTVPDDTADRQEVQWSDPRLTATGNLGSAGGFSFAGGPRLVLPLSAPSRKADAILGAGLTMNVIRPFDVLDGLALVAGGSFIHTFAGNITRADDDVKNDFCNDVVGSRVSCPLSNAGIVQDGLRAVGSASLNINTKVSLQASYLYGWNLVKKLPDIDLANLPPNDGTTDFVGAQRGTRWRRLGSLSLAVNYQPTDWVIATVQGNTSVCYNSDVGSQSSLGGCAGGQKQDDFWLYNPIVNKFSTLALQFTIPIDAVYMRIKNRQGEEKKTAAARAAGKL